MRDCLKTATIVPVPVKSAVSSLNDYHPVALTTILIKCFEKLVLQHTKDNISASLTLTSMLSEPTDPQRLPDPLLYTQSSRTLMLVVDFSSSFNTSLLIGKLNTLGLSTTLCNWLYDFLTNPREYWLAVTTPLCWCSTLKPPRAVCSAPSGSLCTSWLHSQTAREEQQRLCLFL